MLHKILDWIYPPRCMGCEQLLPIQTRADFCCACAELIHPISRTAHVCALCGKPISPERTHCPDCKKKPAAFSVHYAVYEYDDAVREMIHRFKFGAHPSYGRRLGALMATALDASVFSGIDWLMPVPMHSKKKRKRGYNQAELLARALARATGIPLATGILLRARQTRPQSSLNMTERENNVRGAFALNLKWAAQIADRRVMLIDDIYTTGSTLRECAAVLALHGTREIRALSLAITVKA